MFPKFISKDQWISSAEVGSFSHWGKGKGGRVSQWTDGKPWFCRVSVNVYPRVSTLQAHYNGHGNGSIHGGILQVFEVCRIHIPYFARSGTSIGHIGAFPQIWMLFFGRPSHIPVVPRELQYDTISINIFGEWTSSTSAIFWGTYIASI